MNYLKLEIFHNLSGKGNYFQRSYLYCFHSTKFLFVLKGTIISEERRHLPVKWVLFYQPHPQLFFRYNFLEESVLQVRIRRFFDKTVILETVKKIRKTCVVDFTVISKALITHVHLKFEIIISF